MTKPDYAALFAAIANTSNTIYANTLLEQAYTFVEALSNTEIQFFEYVNFDYTEYTPGIRPETVYVYDGGGAPNTAAYVGLKSVTATELYYFVNDAVVDDYIALAYKYDITQYTSYVGVYIDDEGTYSGNYP